MASTRKTAAGKDKNSGKQNSARSKSAGRKKKSAAPKRHNTFSAKSILIVLSLLAMLLVTVGVVGYVIFFRTVLAENNRTAIQEPTTEMVSHTLYKDSTSFLLYRA